MTLIPILLYHSVRDERRPDRWTVRPHVFAEHVAAIRASGRQPMRIGELAAALRGEVPLPAAPVAITFDDGFADTYTAACKLLAAGITSTLFVTTGRIGAPLMLSPAAVRELATTGGVEVGAHAVHHVRLDELPLDRAREEITASRAVLEELTGRAVRSFAYPHGAYDRCVRREVDVAGYTAAAAVRNALSSDADDPLALARWTVTRDVPAERIAAVLAGEGVPVASPRERLRTRGWRTVRRARRGLRSAAPRDAERGRGAPPASGGDALRAPEPVAPDAGPRRPSSAAVVVCTASAARSEQLLRCVEAIRTGTRRPDELFVVVDRNDDLRRTLRAALPSDVRVLLSAGVGLSEARNAGLRQARSANVAFVDDDARPEPHWLERLVAPLERDARLLGTGGDVVPEWEEGPRWLPAELNWTVGCRYRGHPVQAAPIRNPIGCNMAFRRSALEQLGGFAPAFGKRGHAPVVCEETELCLRLERELGPDRILYVPEARVQHHVPAERVTWRLLAVRSLSEGLSKGRLRRMYDAPAVRNEQDYVATLLTDALPALAGRGVRRRDPVALMGGAAILVSLASSAVGFAIGLVPQRPRPPAAS